MMQTMIGKIAILIVLLRCRLNMSEMLAYGTENMESNDKCKLSVSNLIHRFPEGRPVYGVQPVGDEIYIIRDSTSYIEVFDRNTWQYKRNITVAGMKGPYDMVQSSQSPASLFIADWYNSKNLTRVKVPDGSVTQWSFQEDVSTTLGLTGSSRFTGADILVTATVSKTLKEFSPTGSLVRRFIMKDIASPRQTIQVASRRYAVCQGYGPPPALHQVCLVNRHGETNKCYGSTQGSGTGQLNIPGRLELNKKGCILVADTGNKRVVLLDRNLKFVKNLISTGLDGPYRLYLDPNGQQLWIADNIVNGTGIAVSGRVLLFGLKTTQEDGKSKL